MRRRAWLMLLLGLGVSALGADAGAADKEEKGTLVEIDGFQSRTPADWKAEKPEGRLRTHQFRIPRAKGDPADAELVIFYFGEGGGGPAEANIERWKGTFAPPEGKKIDDVTKVDKIKVGDVDVTYVDIEGTYRFKPPSDPNAKPEPKPDYRMLGVIFASKKGPYYLRLVGPTKTVAQHKKGFDDWLKGLK